MGVGHVGHPSNRRLYVGETDGATGTAIVAHAALFGSSLPAPTIAEHSDAALTGWSDGPSDARVARYLGYANVPTVEMSLEVGALTATPHLDIDGTSVADAVGQVVAAEGGALFVAGDGFAVMHNRNHRAQQTTPKATFTNNDIDPDARVGADLQGLVNYAAITATVGAAQVASDAASIAIHEQYPIDASVLLPSEDAALDLASWTVGNYAAPAQRIPNLNLDLMTLPTATQQAALALTFGDRFALTGMPAQVDAAMDLVVEGLVMSGSSTSWAMGLNTSPWALAQTWILEDAVYGVLGVTTRLGY